MKLRPYQVEALEAVVEAEKRGITKQLIVLPTGCGKTVIFTSLGNVRPNSYPMLVIAHREELLDQAADKFAQANPDLKVGKEQATHAADLDCDVVVASIATIGRATGDRIKKWEPGHFRTIVIDEAHHAAAQSYVRAVDYFDCDVLLGVTATPQRGDNVNLQDVFSEVVYYKSILEMIQGGWLSPLVGYRVDTGTDISSVGSRAGDYIESELTQAIDTPERNALIVKAYNDLAAGRPTLVFAAGIQHAKDIVKAFKDHGPSVSVDCILGETDSAVRHDLYARVRSGECQVLVNVGVLTEGFDEPSISCIILARPTRSNGLYTQIVGRGTRLFDGKRDCIVIDLADVTKGKKPIGLPSLLGLPSDFDLDGRELTDAFDSVSELLQKSPEAISRVRSFEDIDAEYKLIDIFRPPRPSATVLEHSNFIWTEVSDGEFSIGVAPTVRMHIIGSLLGGYDLLLECKGIRSTLFKSADIRETFAYADKYVERTYPAEVKMLKIDAAWRRDGPTEKQLKYLRRIGVPITTDLSKGEASLIISKYIEDHPRSYAQQAVIDRSRRKKVSGGW